MNRDRRSPRPAAGASPGRFLNRHLLGTLGLLAAVAGVTGCATSLLWRGWECKDEQQLVVVRGSRRAERAEIVAKVEYYFDYDIAYRLAKAPSAKTNGPAFPGEEEGHFRFSGDHAILGTILSGPLPLEVKSVRVKLANRLLNSAYPEDLFKMVSNFYLVPSEALDLHGGRVLSARVLSVDVSLDLPSQPVRVLDPEAFPPATFSRKSDFRMMRYLEFVEPSLRGTVRSSETALRLLASWWKLVPVAWLCDDDRVCDAPKDPRYAGSWTWDAGRRVGTSPLWIPLESPIEGMLFRDPGSGKLLAVRLRPRTGEARTTAAGTITDMHPGSWPQARSEPLVPLLPSEGGPVWLLRERDPSTYTRILADGDPRVSVEFVEESMEYPSAPLLVKVIGTPFTLVWDLATWPLVMPLYNIVGNVH
jgi:hypothetical protein